MGFGFKVQDSGFRVQDSGFRVKVEVPLYSLSTQGPGFRAKRFGYIHHENADFLLWVQRNLLDRCFTIDSVIHRCTGVPHS
jgi:hypothetical protein